MESTTMRRQLPEAVHLLLARVLDRLLDRNRAEERAAAARYWAAIGHDMPIEDRAQRLRDLAQHAPTVKVRRSNHHSW